LQRSIDRFTMLINDDIETVQPYTRHAAWQRDTALAAMNPNNKTLIDRFVQRFMNTTVVYEKNGTAKHVYRCGSMINWWGIVHPKSFVTVWSEYHPGRGGDYCTITPNPPGPAPFFSS